MRFIEVLVEGSSDVPAAREVLKRRLGLEEDKHFRIHPHRGKGRLPTNLLKKPDAGHDFLLTQLPLKLRNYGRMASGTFFPAVVVLVDADRDDCKRLKASLTNMLERLDHKPPQVLFRIAVEETESWFLAQPNAVQRAYSRAKLSEIKRIAPDQVCGAWERLAEALGYDPQDCGGQDKQEWATAIAPHLDLDEPLSPSLRAFIEGVARMISAPPT